MRHARKICCSILLRMNAYDHVTPILFVTFCAFATFLTGSAPGSAPAQLIGADVTSDATTPPARRPGGHSERHAYWRGNEPARQGGLVGWQGLLEAQMTGAERGANLRNFFKNCLCEKRFATETFALVQRKICSRPNRQAGSDVHVVGICSMALATLIFELFWALRDVGRL